MAKSKANHKFIATLVNKYVASMSVTTATDNSESSRKRRKTAKLPLPPEDYVPTLSTYHDLYAHRFTLKQLQGFAKTLHVKISDVKKDMLIHHIFMHFVLTRATIFIQSRARGYLQRKLLKLQGFLKPGCAPFSRKCINDTDFVTLEDVGEISPEYYYGYETGTGGTYGFNITSLYNYCITCIKGGTALINPYTREPFRDTLMYNIMQIIHLSSAIVKRPLVLKIEEPICTAAQQMELKAVSVFQTLNELGNYSDVNWFLELSRDATVQYIAEFYDIWNHRAGLSQQLKSELCPPDGNLFRNNLQHRITHEPDVCRMKMGMLGIFSRMVQTDYVALDNRKLNAMYILAGLTLVSPVAADAMPVYYFSVNIE